MLISIIIIFIINIFAINGLIVLFAKSFLVIYNNKKLKKYYILLYPIQFGVYDKR
jgi:hypothetical protein